MFQKPSIVRRIYSGSNSLPDTILPVLKRVYHARGVHDPKEVDYTLNNLLQGSGLQQIDKAVDLLSNALIHDKRILIIGDYDADGATSTALAVRALRLMGANDVQYLVPNRFEFGYGLSPEIVEVAKQYSPQLIVTVDNGVSSNEGVASAKAAGISVLITDHHLPGEILPLADAIVNPNLADDAFPSKCLAGVGVIFYVLAALRSALRENGWFVERGLAEPNLGQFLDLVALGTVADVVPLDQNNRILIEQGLRRIRSGRCIQGIKALLQCGNRTYKNTVASDLGFVLGPRLNAAGRLEDMSLGIECLLADDFETAKHHAQILDGMNKERRVIEQDMQSQASRELEGLKSEIDDKDLPAGLCLFHKDWHQGVIGILASRIKDKTHRPVIAFAPVSEQELKGSGRSVSGFHIRDALDVIACRYPGLIMKFGGHAMAAGLSMSVESYSLFKQAFAEEADRKLREQAGQGVIYSDGELLPEELILKTAQVIREGGPWGQGFPEPVFDGEFNLINHRIVGGSHLKLTLADPESGVNLDAIAFNETGEGLQASTNKVNIAYRMEVNEYNGMTKLQLNIVHLEPVS